jgi:CO dehydrogenase/acetyl-CoA synthase alpha subunit
MYRRALDDGQARAVGSLAATAATSGIVDTCVVEGALRRHDLVVSSDETHLHVIAAAASRHLEVDRP